MNENSASGLDEIQPGDMFFRHTLHIAYQGIFKHAAVVAFGRDLIVPADDGIVRHGRYFSCQTARPAVTLMIWEPCVRGLSGISVNEQNICFAEDIL